MAKVNNKFFLALWFLNPFVSAIYLFRHFKTNNSFYPYLLLSFFFGLSFVVSTSVADSERYAEELRRYHQENISLAAVFTDFYSDESSKIDIYQPLVTWLVSVFTDNANVLFSFFAVVFGYFYFKSLLIVRSYITAPLVGLTLITFLIMALTNPIWNINGVRMWTAVMIFFYGILLLNLKNKKKGWLFLFLPMLVHFSLVIALVLHLVFLVLPIKSKTILFALFIITFFLGELNLEVLRGYFEQLPGFAQSRKGYLSDEYSEQITGENQQLAIHVFLAGKISQYSILLMTLTMYLYSILKNKIRDNYVNTFFGLGLFFASFSNLASSVPSGGRFVTLSNLIILTAFLFFLNKKIVWTPVLKISLTVPLLFVVIFNIRVGLDYLGIFFFIGNPLVNWFITDSPIIDFIKSLF